MQDRKQLVFFAGLNGAGKTTTYVLACQKIPHLKDLIYINPDILTVREGGDFIKGARAALTLREESLRRGLSFVFESTFSGNSEIRLLKEAKLKYYEINGVLVGTDNIDLNLKRISERVMTGGHFVPDEDVRRRAGRLLSNYPSILELTDRLYLVDNTRKSPKIQAVIKNGEIKLRKHNSASWINVFLELLKKHS